MEDERRDQPAIADLTRQFVKGNVSVFVGAGLSADAVPVWSDLMEQFGSRSGKYPEGSSATDVAQFYEDEYDRGLLIATLREEIKKNTKKKVLPIHSSLLALPIRHIFTTNFDGLIENAIGASSDTCELIVEETDVPRFRFDDRENIHVVKVHGDIDKQSSIVFTAMDYENYLRVHPAMSRLVQFILQTRYVLFLGYSFADPDLRTMLGTVLAETGGYGNHSFIVLIDPHEAVVRGLSKRRLQVIALKSGGRGKSAVIKEWLDSLRTRISTERGRTSSPNVNTGAREALLPHPTYVTFIARSALEDRLRAHLTQHGVTTLYGLPGAGKSSLVNRVVREIARCGKPMDFEYVAWLTAEGPKTPREWRDWTLTCLARATANQLTGNLPLDEVERKAEEMEAFLKEHPVLLVIDDYHCVGSEELDAWIEGLSAKTAGKSRVLVIRRPPQDYGGVSEDWIAIEGMSDPEAIALIKVQAKALQIEAYITRESEGAILELIHFVQGNPQALEQSMGLIARTGRNIQAVIEDLQLGNAPDVGSILNILCEKSWMRISESAKSILKAAPIFSESISIRHDALQEVSGIKNGKVFDAGLGELVAFRLLETAANEKRYTIHPTTRSFARRLLDNDRQFALTCRRRLVEFTLSLVRSFVVRETPDHRYWNALVTDGMNGLDREWPSVKEVVDWVMAEQPRDVVEFTMLLVHYLDSRFFNADRLRYVLQAIEVLARAPKDREDLALLRLDALGWTYIEEGRLDEADAQVQAGAELAAKVPGQEGSHLLALARAWQGRIRSERADAKGNDAGTTARLLEEGEQLVQQALELDPTFPWILARVYMAAGDIAFKQNDYCSAMTRYERAVAEEEKYGGEARQYQLAPRVGLAHLGLQGEARRSGNRNQEALHLNEAVRMFSELAEQKTITVGKLYGEYGLALIDFAENKLGAAHERVLEVRKNLDRQTSSSVLKKMIDKLFADLTTADGREAPVGSPTEPFRT